MPTPSHISQRGPGALEPAEHLGSHSARPSHISGRHQRGVIQFGVLQSDMPVLLGAAVPVADSTAWAPDRSACARPAAPPGPRRWHRAAPEARNPRACMVCSAHRPEATGRLARNHLSRSSTFLMAGCFPRSATVRVPHPRRAHRREEGQHAAIPATDPACAQSVSNNPVPLATRRATADWANVFTPRSNVACQNARVNMSHPFSSSGGSSRGREPVHPLEVPPFGSLVVRESEGKETGESDERGNGSLTHHRHRALHRPACVSRPPWFVPAATPHRP